MELRGEIQKNRFLNKVNVTQEDGESVKIRYYSTDAKLINESQIISISTTGDTYANVDDVTATDGDSTLVGIYFDAEEKEWLHMSDDLAASLESISEAHYEEEGDQEG